VLTGTMTTSTTAMWVIPNGCSESTNTGDWTINVPRAESVEIGTTVIVRGIVLELLGLMTVGCAPVG